MATMGLVPIQFTAKFSKQGEEIQFPPYDVNCLANFIDPNCFVNFAVNDIVPGGSHGSTSDN
jgi:hypothetical protein